MKTIKLLATLAVSALLIVSCGDDNNQPNPPKPNFDNKNLKGEFTKDITLKAGIDYLLTGSLRIKEGATLTIEPGTVIKAEAGGTNVYVAVERGAKLVAKGTASKPIIFESNATNPGVGDWGGIVIAGKAKTNKGTEVQTEVAGMNYGGTNNADNSGVLTYVKISHTGAKINGDQEFNGLSLYTVGTGTKIENIFISNGADDGIELFGGTVNVTNLMCVNIKDDMFDFTGGYAGTITNAFGIREAGFNQATEDPRGIEGDSNDSNTTAQPISTPTFNKVTILNLSKGQKLKAGAEIRRGTKAKINNVLFAAVEGAEFGNLIDTTDKKGDGSVTLTNAIKYGNVGINKVGGAINGDVIEDTSALTIDGNKVTIKVDLGADFNAFEWTGYTELKK